MSALAESVGSATLVAVTVTTVGDVLTGALGLGLAGTAALGLGGIVASCCITKLPICVNRSNVRPERMLMMKALRSLAH